MNEWRTVKINEHVYQLYESCGVFCSLVIGEKYALLIGIHEDEEEHEHGCGCGCEDGDEDVLIAKIVKNEQGEEEYVDPTDEEFDAVQKAYDAIMDEEEAKENE